MIGLDTNVLVRYITQDDAAQSPRVNALIERRLTDDDPGFVSVVAMAELAWVLQRAYGYAPIDIAAAIERILQTSTFVVESEPEIFTAVTALREGVASFTDALIGALDDKAGCAITYTFDRRATRLPNFALVP
jgi:predicted nucleic-acid-binding protein